MGGWTRDLGSLTTLVGAEPHCPLGRRSDGPWTRPATPGGVRPPAAGPVPGPDAHPTGSPGSGNEVRPGPRLPSHSQRRRLPPAGSRLHAARPVARLLVHGVSPPERGHLAGRGFVSGTHGEWHAPLSRDGRELEDSPRGGRHGPGPCDARPASFPPLAGPTVVRRKPGSGTVPPRGPAALRPGSGSPQAPAG